MGKVFSSVLILVTALVLSFASVFVASGSVVVKIEADSLKQIKGQQNLTLISVSVDRSEVINKALDYLRTQQEPDGGLNWFGASSETATIPGVISLSALGRPQSSFRQASTGKTMLDFLADKAIAYIHDDKGTSSANLFPDNAALLLSAVVSAKQDPTSFAGINLVQKLNETYVTATGAYSTTAMKGWDRGEATDISQAWVIIGLSMAGQTIPDKAVDWLINNQAVDGSWGFGDPDTTAVAVIALIASGKATSSHPAIQKAFDYFRNTQLDSGGWRPSWDTDPANANSTGWIIQAILTAGQDPNSSSWTKGQNTPVKALINLQKPDGSIGGTYANSYSTVEALYGLLDKPLFVSTKQNLSSGARNISFSHFNPMQIFFYFYFFTVKAE